MAEAVAQVARKARDAVDNESDTLDLANCLLNSFPEGLCHLMRTVAEKICIVILANNALKSLTRKFITTFTQLRELNLEGNYFRHLPEDIVTLEHLTNINLARNKFKEFPDQLTHLQSLETINLEANEIVELPIEKLILMPSLKHLNLKGNPINKDDLVLPSPAIKFELIISEDQEQTDATVHL
ncbi:leucine-rich repeat-containing protein 20 isoform X2 [Protopterus annectens]|nr:leucine-rich repeat-containing protein 20 isoform X2 [Protopterus annectens]